MCMWPCESLRECLSAKEVKVFVLHRAIARLLAAPIALHRIICVVFAGAGCDNCSSYCSNAANWAFGQDTTQHTPVLALFGVIIAFDIILMWDLRLCCGSASESQW